MSSETRKSSHTNVRGCDISNTLLLRKTLATMDVRAHFFAERKVGVFPLPMMHPCVVVAWPHTAVLRGVVPVFSPRTSTGVGSVIESAQIKYVDVEHWSSRY